MADPSISKPAAGGYADFVARKLSMVQPSGIASKLELPDYLITMRAPGEAAEHVTHTTEEFPVHLWQKIASPVWMDINPSDALQYKSAREHDDEKHICPLQLDVIRRGVLLWSNPSDIVLSPFMGIGSEGFVSLEMGRRFVGVELKRSYFEQACRNLAGVLSNRAQDLFAEPEAA